MRRDPWLLVERSGRIVLYRRCPGRRKFVASMTPDEALDRGGALLLAGLGGVDRPAQLRAGWRVWRRCGLVHVEDVLGKPIDVMSPQIAVDEGSALMLAGEAVLATAPLVSSDAGVTW